MEEIFGEIEDEYDVKSKFVKKEAENEYVLSGRVEIDYLNEQYGLELLSRTNTQPWQGTSCITPAAFLKHMKPLLLESIPLKYKK